MEPNREESSKSDELAQFAISHLILKLRWIGLEEEAKKLESVALDVPPDRRGSVSFGPFSTD
jgi:hypothetical protein